MSQRHGRKQPDKRNQLQFEALENRTLLAGNVSAVLAGDDLIVAGDGADNAVEIRIADGNLVVQRRAGSDTTVNGEANTVFEGVDNVEDLRVFLGGGDDVLDIAGLLVTGDATIEADAFFSVFLPDGHGNDQVLLDQLAIAGDLNVLTGTGDDVVALERSEVAGDTTIETGTGDDRVALVGVALDGHAALDSGRGNDIVLITQTAVGGISHVDTGKGKDEVLIHGASLFGDDTFLDGGPGKDTAEIDAETTFARGLETRRFKSVTEVEVTEFSAAEGLAVRRLPFGDPAGTGSEEFSLNGASFSGGEVTFTGIPGAYATAPTTYIAGSDGAVIGFDEPVDSVRFFFVHFPGAPTGTATAYDAAGNVIAVVESHETTFLGDPGNFVTLSGKKSIAAIVIEGGMIDNVSFIE